MTVLIDTNVVLDYTPPREHFVEAAAKCFERLALKKEIAYISATTITDIYYITRRETKNSDTAKDVVAKLLNSFQVASVDGSDCIKALSNGMNDYEDAIQEVCAKKVKADYIITRNVKDFAKSRVKSVSPEEFLIITPSFGE
jgi:predicted nucleic acid-binding protein